MHVTAVTPAEAGSLGWKCDLHVLSVNSGSRLGKAASQPQPVSQDRCAWGFSLGGCHKSSFLLDGDLKKEANFLPLSQKDTADMWLLELGPRRMNRGQMNGPGRFHSGLSAAWAVKTNPFFLKLFATIHWLHGSSAAHRLYGAVRKQIHHLPPSISPHFQGLVFFFQKVPPEWPRQRCLYYAMSRAVSLQLCGALLLSNAIRCTFLPNSSFMNFLQSYSFVSQIFPVFLK